MRLFPALSDRSTTALRGRHWLSRRLPTRRVGPVLDVTGQMVREWRADRVTGLAAEVAFWGVLSLLPAFVAVAAALGSLSTIIGADAATAAERELLEFLRRVLTDEASGAIAAVRQLFDGESGGILTFAVAGALWALSRALNGIIEALDVVYDLEEQRTWVKQRALALGLALGSVVVAALVIVAVVVGPLLGTGRDVADAVGLGSTFATAWTWLRWPAVVAALVVWAGAIFQFAPNHRTRWRSGLPGALLTTAAWIAVSLGFSAYLSIAPGANAVFGALGGALIFLMWLYLLGICLLVGGELNAVLATRRRGRCMNPPRVGK